MFCEINPDKDFLEIENKNSKCNNHSTQRITTDTISTWFTIRDNNSILPSFIHNDFIKILENNSNFIF